jgi:predicted O-methyltransferase YrrM
MLNPVSEEIYRTQSTLSSDGQTMKVSSGISRTESLFICERIKEKPGLARTLEVGCAQGLSSLAICESTRGRPGAHHYIIDPFQTSDWKGAGVAALARAGLKHFTLVEERSEIALPRLLPDNEGRLDFILVDGWHTFDHTLLDCFYAIRLLKVGGCLVVDDCNMPPIAKAIRYLSNYPCLELTHAHTDYPSGKLKNAVCRAASIVPIPMDIRARLPRSMQRRMLQVFRRQTMVCLTKTAPDGRKWNWYKPF